LRVAPCGSVLAPLVHTALTSDKNAKRCSRQGFSEESESARRTRSSSTQWSQALDALSYALVKRKVNYVLDADIQGFFDNLDKAWMIKFVEHRVADRRILRLIQKWLKAGVMEEGKWSDTETGTPQGSVISPLLANIYLHYYAFDLWVDVWRKKCARGEVIVLRYADDIVLGFQWGTDADRFRQSFGERLGKFGLELHPDKTRRIEFGRYAEQNRKRRGEGKPETFDFLGFTHISGKNGTGLMLCGV
jgi:RNA-directed DNA polymerase